jgi:hypothetical protein
VKGLWKKAFVCLRERTISVFVVYFFPRNNYSVEPSNRSECSLPSHLTMILWNCDSPSSLNDWSDVELNRISFESNILLLWFFAKSSFRLNQLASLFSITVFWMPVNYLVIQTSSSSFHDSSDVEFPSVLFELNAFCEGDFHGFYVSIENLMLWQILIQIEPIHFIVQRHCLLRSLT